jgi:hypothetical protein
LIRRLFWSDGWEAELTTDDKNIFDALMKLSDFRFQRWQDRRKYEWRISIGLWALIAAWIYYAEIARTSPPPVVTVVLMLVVFMLHAWWVRINWISNLKDINHAFYYSDHARNLLGPDWPNPKEEQGPKGKWGGLKEDQSRRFSFLKDHVCLAEIAATGVLASVAIIYLLLPVSKCPI